MDGSRFDRFAKGLAASRLSRRSSLRHVTLTLASSMASLGVGIRASEALAASVKAAATPSPTHPDEIEIDGMWFCNQPFALCTTAPCEPSESDPTIAKCHCIVENAYSIGNKTCAERKQSGKNLVSNFSTVNVNSEFSVLMCPEDAPWANCLDVSCEIDAFNPAVTTCQCAIVDTGPSLTFGGGCNASTCTSTIWSAAPTDYIGLAQYEEGMKRVNQEVTLPPACPAAAPVASPSA